jgi:hypothetical protein
LSPLSKSFVAVAAVLAPIVPISNAMALPPLAKCTSGNACSSIKVTDKVLTNQSKFKVKIDGNFEIRTGPDDAILVTRKHIILEIEPNASKSPDDRRPTGTFTANYSPHSE